MEGDMEMPRRNFIYGGEQFESGDRCLRASRADRANDFTGTLLRALVWAAVIVILFSAVPGTTRGAFADEVQTTNTTVLAPIEAGTLEGAQGYAHGRGSRGEAVRSIQQMLNDQSYLPDDQIDGIFGPKTEAAVQAFQEANGLMSTGIADLPTQFRLAELESGFALVEGKPYEYAGLVTYGVYRFEGGVFIGLVDGDGSYRDGTLYYRDGATYAGSFKNNQRSGKGEAWFPNGDYYSGDWKDDNMNGEGVYHFGAVDSIEKYDGEWRDGRMSGKGTYTFPDGCTIKAVWEDNRQTGWWN